MNFIKKWFSKETNNTVAETAVIEEATITSLIEIEDVREDRPQFKRVYSGTIINDIRVEITTYTLGCCKRSIVGRMYQPNRSYIFFDPERIADKILDPVLVPEVEKFVSDVFAMDESFIASEPDTYVDDNGDVWKKVKQE